MILQCWLSFFYKHSPINEVSLDKHTLNFRIFSSVINWKMKYYLVFLLNFPHWPSAHVLKEQLIIAYQGKVNPFSIETGRGFCFLNF